MAEESRPPFLFHLIGSASALSLVLLLLLTLRGLLTGDYGLWARFLEQHPGIEPFLIFVLPVILIAGPAWVWVFVRPFYRSRSRP